LLSGDEIIGEEGSEKMWLLRKGKILSEGRIREIVVAEWR